MSDCNYCGVTRLFAVRPQVITFVRRERHGLSVWLSMGIVGSSSALEPRSRRFWVRSFRIASVKPADRHPAVSPTPEPFTAVFQVCFGTGILQSSRLPRLSFCLLSLPASFNRNPASPYQWALSGPPETMTQLELQSSSFAWARLFVNRQLNSRCSLCLTFQAHMLTTQLTVLVTVSAAHQLAGSSSRSGYLTLAV